MLKLDLKSKIKDDNELITKASIEVHGNKAIVVREVACAIEELIKYSAELGEDEQIFVMSTIMKAIAGLGGNTDGQ